MTHKASSAWQLPIELLSHGSIEPGPLERRKLSNIAAKDEQEVHGKACYRRLEETAPGDFEKSCKALIEATSISEGNTPTTAQASTSLTGCCLSLQAPALTLLATEMQGARARRMAVADTVSGKRRY